MQRVSVKVLFFGEAHQLAGKREEYIEFPVETNYEEVRATVLEKFPTLTKIEKVMMLAVDQEYANPEDPIQLERFSEIAVIPPLSGG
ncbi:unnamed protein product [Caenorhabditis sp. 36 PRJEB53466]|nr:unnamed protein product [Caenorhabditis sp. 36 PRJEB53466]